MTNVLRNWWKIDRNFFILVRMRENFIIFSRFHYRWFVILIYFSYEFNGKVEKLVVSNTISICAQLVFYSDFLTSVPRNLSIPVATTCPALGSMPFSALASLCLGCCIGYIVFIGASGCALFTCHSATPVCISQPH